MSGSGAEVDVETAVGDLVAEAEVDGDDVVDGVVDDVERAIAAGGLEEHADPVTRTASRPTHASQREGLVFKLSPLCSGLARVSECAGNEGKVTIGFTGTLASGFQREYQAVPGLHLEVKGGTLGRA